jgi:hypothetical protein
MKPIEHGALSFKPAATGRRSIGFACGDHQNSGQASGAYRVAIAGHPIIREGKRTLGELHLCANCVKRWIAEWDSARNLPASDHAARPKKAATA